MPNTLGAGLGNIPFPNTTIYPETVDTGYPNALMIRGWCTGVPSDSTATRYAPGATLLRTDAGTGQAQIYYNAGTTASPVWVGTIVANNTVGYSQVATQVSGTAAANVFGATNPFGGTVTGVIVVAGDPSGGTVTLTGSNGTITQVSKGTTTGAVTGGSITFGTTSTGFIYGGTLFAQSTGSGSATIFATFISNSIV